MRSRYSRVTFLGLQLATLRPARLALVLLCAGLLTLLLIHLRQSGWQLLVGLELTTRIDRALTEVRHLRQLFDGPPRSDEVLLALPPTDPAVSAAILQTEARPEIRRQA